MYLEQRNLNVNFWEMSPEELDPVLGTFWFCACQAKLDKEGNEKKYMSQSIKGLPYGINRVLVHKKYISRFTRCFQRRTEGIKNRRLWSHNTYSR